MIDLVDLAKGFANSMVFPFFVLSLGLSLDLPVAWEYPAYCSVLGFGAYSYVRVMEVYREVRDR